MTATLAYVSITGWVMPARVSLVTQGTVLQATHPGVAGAPVPPHAETVCKSETGPAMMGTRVYVLPMVLGTAMRRKLVILSRVGHGMTGERVL